jgi:hypothetical protein
MGLRMGNFFKLRASSFELQASRKGKEDAFGVRNTPPCSELLFVRCVTDCGSGPKLLLGTRLGAWGLECGVRVGGAGGGGGGEAAV